MVRQKHLYTFAFKAINAYASEFFLDYHNQLETPALTNAAILFGATSRSSNRATRSLHTCVGVRPSCQAVGYQVSTHLCWGQTLLPGSLLQGVHERAVMEEMVSCPISVTSARCLFLMLCHQGFPSAWQTFFKCFAIKAFPALDTSCSDARR